jgi:hypothetical protein
VADQRLEKCLVGNPRGLEKAHDVAALFCEIKDPFDSTATQTPPLAADLDLEIFWDFAGEAEFALKIEGGVKAALLGPLVEEVAIDEPLFFHASLDPVTVKIIKALDIVDIGTIKELMGVFGRFDGHAIAREHVEMRGAWESVNSGFDGVERGLDQGPFAPTAFDPLFGEGYVWIALKRGFYHFEMVWVGARIKVDRHIVAHSREALGLLDDGLWVFMAKKDESYFCHFRNIYP